LHFKQVCIKANVFRLDAVVKMSPLTNMDMVRICWLVKDAFYCSWSISK